MARARYNPIMLDRRNPPDARCGSPPPGRRRLATRRDSPFARRGAGPVARTLPASVVGLLLVSAAVLTSGGAAAAAVDPESGGTAVGLDLTVENGLGRPLTVIPGREYFVDLIDLIAEIEEVRDEGIDGIRERSFLSGVDWSGLLLFREEWIAEGGGWLRRRIYRDATWMRAPQSFLLERLDAGGNPAGKPIRIHAGQDDVAGRDEAFAVRRPAAIQTAHACPGEGDCTGATFLEEGLFQLRNADRSQAAAFILDPGIVSLRLTWSLLPESPFTIPIAYEPAPEHDYGLGIESELLGGAADGAVSPGDSVSVRVTFTDGRGVPLHAPGSLPSYRDFLDGRSAGLRYYAFEQGVLFFKDKNKEGVLLAALGGPVGRIRQIYSEVPLAEFFRRTQLVATPARDGYFAEWQLVPPGDVLFGGAFGDSAAWEAPVSDTLTFHVPSDAEPGEYIFVIKARREYLGESALATAERRLRVGTGSVPDEAWVGGCERCHAGALALGDLLHGNGDPPTCDLCHAPLEFEPDNMLAYRAHYVHYFSNRYPADKAACTECHRTPRSIERQSLLACLSCHLEYHGGAEHFGTYGRCADLVLCHPDHNFPSAETFVPLPPPGAETLRPRPNPANPRVSVPFRLAAPGRVRIRVLDVQGRVVARLFDGVVPSPGPRVVEWGGATEAGRPAPSGVYFVVIDTSSGAIRHRVQIIR
jgi:hypothetical protein